MHPAPLHLVVLGSLVLAAAACAGRADPEPTTLRWPAPRLDPVRPDRTEADGFAIVDLVADTVGALCSGAGECVAGRECRLRCPRGRSFHDGSPVTPEAVAAAIETTWASPGAARVEGDELVVDVPLGASQPLPGLPVMKALPDGLFVGTGRYRIADATKGHLVLQSVDPARRPARIEIDDVGSIQAVLARFLAGKADLAVSLPDVDERLLAAAGVVGQAAPGGRALSILVFDEALPAFADPEIRRCLSGLVAPALARWRARAGLEPPPFDLARPVDRRRCKGLLRGALPEPLMIEATDLGDPRLTVEAVQEALTEATGIHTVVVPAQDLKAPLTEPLRLTYLNPDHPNGLAVYTKTGAQMNVGRHHDPALDRLIEAGAPEEEVLARLAASPPFVAVGLLRLWLVASHRFEVEVDPASGREVIRIRPAKEARD